MYLKHPSETLPADMEMPIWRYMTFTRFQSLLQNKGLFFSRPDCLLDKFEGTWGRASLDAIEENLRRKLAAGLTLPVGIEEQMAGIRATAEQMRKVTAVNCWNLSPNESEAMWKLYIPDGKGVAIRSTPISLKGSFPNDPNIAIGIGCIQYIDHKVEPIPFSSYVNPYLYKRKSLDHERELRAVARKEQVRITDREFHWNATMKEFNQPGEFVHVNLTTLIKAVRVAPGAFGSMKEPVAAELASFGLADVPVERSDIDEEPIG